VSLANHSQRREALLCAFERPAICWPLVLFAADLALFGAGSALALLAGALALKLVGSLLVATAIVRLFLIGHDACHGSFLPNQAMNRVLGRIAFLPSMTAFSLWDVGHNVAHHGFNNLKGRDQVWTPFSKAEFDALPRNRRRLERLYRSGFGCGAYYLIELWWRKLYFPSQREIGSTRLRYRLDSALVTLGALVWLAVVAHIARATGQSFLLLASLAVVGPFLLWNGIMGFVVFVHHTHPQIAWFARRLEWQRSRAYLTATANVRLPFGLDRLLHNIMDHHAHHVNPRIPMFRLRGAQRRLRERHPAQGLSYRLDFRNYLDCVRCCKLYDFSTHSWLDFHGQVTSAVAMMAAPHPRAA
jgi:omega-6 fatty acid desaturase (delta-12 desaturase)